MSQDVPASEEATVKISRIGSRCTRVAQALASPAQDEITLLRSARALKGIHSDLRQAVWNHARATGWTAAISAAETALAAIEHDLRQVLLEYPALRRDELREHVARALDGSIETLDSLKV